MVRLPQISKQTCVSGLMLNHLISVQQSVSVWYRFRVFIAMHALFVKLGLISSCPCLCRDHNAGLVSTMYKGCAKQSVFAFE